MTPTISRATSARRVEFFLAAVAILCGALSLRLTNLYGVPVFIDEANHLNWAQRFSVGDATYPLLMDGKFLLGVLLAQFQVLGPAPLWMARAAVAVLSLIACAACIAVGKSIHSGKAGLLAGVLYSILPLAVFFDRQVLADPLMADFGALAVVFTLWAAKTRRRWAAIPLALSLAAAVLAKLFGVLFLAFPIIGIFILPSQGKRGRLAGTYASATALATLLAAAFLAALRPMWGYDDSKLANQQVGFSTCPPAVCQLDVSKQFNVLLSSANSLLDLIPPYVGWPVVALALCGWLIISRKTKRRETWTLALSSWGMLAAFLLTTRDSPPRYVSFLSMPLAALAASGLLSIAQIIHARLRVAFAVAAVVLLVPTGWPAANTAPILFNPERARLPSLDRQGYFTSGYGGTGIREAALAVLGRETDSTAPPVIVIDGDISQIASYFDRTRVDVRASSEVHPADVGRWMIAGQRIYLLEELVDTSAAQTADSVSRGLLFEEMGRYPRMNGQREIRLRVVTGADQTLRRDIFREFFIKPEKLADEYNALAANLLTQTEDTAVLVYPPNQLEALGVLLDGQPRIITHGIGDSWPLAAAETENALAALTGGKQSVNIVFLEETRGDPDRFIETWLTSHLFRIGETWFGPLRLVEFAGGGESAQTITVGARFGDGIVLESVEVLDSAAKQGGVIRIRLNWRTLAPVAESFKVFVHIFAGDAIVAQHDGQPVGELRPTTTWQTGESVADPFAIRLPNVTPPGVYQLRIGLYDLNTQARAPVTFTDGNGGEFYVGGRITIK